MAHKIKIYKTANIEFSEYLKESIEKITPGTDIFVEGYLTSLLSKFLSKEEDFLSEEPLIYRLTNSKNLEDYIHLGDETLFITGFYPEIMLKKKNKKYVENIGRTSYKEAAIMMGYEAQGKIYLVLANKFPLYSDVLNDVKYNLLENVNDKEFFELYKISKDYKNPRAIKKLEELVK
ncbi:MAG: hypothetical protein KKA79_06610 [Nanoarchaeota archaeon]|nr:hypothetical protein [Nanoarchaeota archaeon]MCG2717387.1 hypothetical protein [Nanoarchaeota archaeon]